MGPAARHPGKTKFDDREPVADQGEPPAKKSFFFSSASAPARPDAGLGGFMEVARALKEFGQSLAEVAAEDDMATGKGRNIDPAMLRKGKSKKGKGKPKGHNIDPALVGKGRPGEAHPAMWKHMKTEMGGATTT